MSAVCVSVIIPSRNEERRIEQTLQHALAACKYLDASREASAGSEVIVVDNGSTDGTAQILRAFQERGEIQVVHSQRIGAARARNDGRRTAKGAILVFVDADTLIPPHSLCRIASHCRQRDLAAGITRLGCLDGGVRARLWWGFWNAVRRLPLPRAKAMPAFMFCTSAAFDQFGPFDEEVAIGEEWPILAGVYQNAPSAFVYDSSLVAQTSSRRMDRQLFGYSRTLFKYGWAIVHRSGRIHYTDTIR